MGLDPTVVTWVVSVITGTLMLYIGVQIRGSKDAKKDHLRRTTALEIAQVKYITHITAKLDSLVAYHQSTVVAMNDMSKSFGKVTASVARIEGVIEGTTKGALK